MSMSENKTILQQVEEYVKELLDNQLPPDITFHTLEHTQQVVGAVSVIGSQEEITRQEMEILILSAWFHDVGFIRSYHKHEERSASIAFDFLSNLGYDKGSIDQIVANIKATCLPQRPVNFMEEILCDADLFHLSQPDYWKRNQLLRRELELCFGIYYEDIHWFRENLKFLQGHRYFTHYGRTVLENGKEQKVAKNIKIVERLDSGIQECD